MCGGGGDGPGCPLWVISFADMIANLVIFFILMATYSSSSSGSAADGGRNLRPGNPGIFGSESTREVPALVARRPGQDGTRDIVGPEERSQRREKEFDEAMSKKVQSAEYSVKPDLKRLADGLHVSLAEPALFVPGSDELGPDASIVLEEIGNFFRGEPCEFIVEAHTDDRTWKFSSYDNDVALTRALAQKVSVLLSKASDIEPARIGFTALGSAYPIASNETAAGRAKNRRVDVIVRQVQ